MFNGVISRGCHEAPNLLTWQICYNSPTGIARRAFSLRPTDCPQGHQLRVLYWVSLALVLGRKDNKRALAGTHDAHEFRLFWLQVQENTTSGPKQALMGELVTTLRLRPVIPISGVMILQGAAQKLVIVRRGIRLLVSLQNREVRANR